MNHIATITIVVCFVLLPPRADAHTPGRLRAGAPFIVESPKDSAGLYGEFVNGDEVFVVRLDFDEKFALPIEIFVPHEARLADHRPAFAIVGVGLPTVDAALVGALPFALPAGAGAVVELNEVSPRPAFFESILRRFYWSCGATAVVMPLGQVEIWVWSPHRTTGKFGLGYGVEEGGGYAAAFSDWSFYAY